MKIIQDKVWWEFVCTACGVTLQAEPDDVKPRPIYDSGDLVGTFPMVECPKCGKIHDIPDNLVTQRLRDKVQDMYANNKSRRQKYLPCYKQGFLWCELI